MMSNCVLIQVLARPDSVLSLLPHQMDHLIQQGRRANLLGRLGVVFEDRNVMEQIPDAARQHLISAMLIAERQHQITKREIRFLRKAFGGAGLPVILLKGAAYVALDCNAAKGRLFSDIDLIVPKTQLLAAESALLLWGWRGTHEDAYDQRYYREWMHEIPPMIHSERGTAIDLHHSILPETARLKINPSALFESLSSTDENGVFAFPAERMFIHSATHLFHEGEFQNGLRDLVDMNALIQQFGQEAEFWPRLLASAVRLGLERPVFYALYFLEEILGAELPAGARQILAHSGPGRISLGLIRVLYQRNFEACWKVKPGFLTRMAGTALLIRSHWLRMPLGMLVRHLAYKYYVRRREVRLA